ncbi:PTS mannitol transporter subunit IICBA [Buchnera aphidicola (Muscaphis stroyani)]|uniref:PTS system mannitol-specific EIICBA component n=1 Tax=Buchnera aphidicola (Muscaphis stroyani) TaxID=1241869 RepID=A0A4D6Y5B6_9GAMM|nr:PTS mannitol transporter subunit IICBA [Buchnera aphidicola]QCI24602.1 PTS mannitol transporter subunit IICBA [Buchnera aphidicola (Muscaphis stroyani)]
MLMLIKSKIQIFGRFLSNMIMPNISIFIVWGIMSALFTSSGWQPNKIIDQKLISAIIFYLLPLLVGYTGGKLIGSERGGLVGIIATMGVITSTSIPMLLGAMIVGPLGGWSIKYFDKKINHKITNGFEMLVNNFSISAIGILWSIISFYTIGPTIEWISNALGFLVNSAVNHNLLPILAIIIEPAKIFFLNNIINHGVFSILGIQDISQKNSSIFFLIESNPGPGLGVLMAWFYFGKGELSKSSGAASIIHFFGGVHEIYFPYVLNKPKLIFSLILGSMTGISLLTFLHGGLFSAASPGSILSVIAMTPKECYLANGIAVFFSFLVSFIISSILLKCNINSSFINNENVIINPKNGLNLLKLNRNNCNFNSINFDNIQKIVVACDAGMGSSAMGSSMLQKKIKKANLMHVSVSNMAIDLLSKDIDLVITHQDLTNRAKIYAPNSQHISLKNFISHDFYDNLVKCLKKNKICKKDHKINLIDDQKEKKLTKRFEFRKENIFLNQHANNKEEAIRFIGNNLVKQGYVKSNYVDSMLEREKITSTWLGESIALPHGTIEAKNDILKTGVIFCQFPKGVLFGENIDDIAYLVIGVAAKNNEHITLVSSITNALDDRKIIKKLSQTSSVQEVLSLLSAK